MLFPLGECATSSWHRLLLCLQLLRWHGCLTLIGQGDWRSKLKQGGLLLERRWYCTNKSSKCSRLMGPAQDVAQDAQCPERVY